MRVDQRRIDEKLEQARGRSRIRQGKGWEKDGRGAGWKRSKVEEEQSGAKQGRGRTG